MNSEYSWVILQFPYVSIACTCKTIFISLMAVNMFSVFQEKNHIIETVQTG